ncbi:oxidoreductase [Boudabousia marimammalium]|uniref:Oxidoreductase n=2 Tax=Boudabousia marimammalium TaxID=156892 RepID=A0A1Q5PSX4_9ACTO|nr:oxidoreductase [Boudabousia marimammalium]
MTAADNAIPRLALSTGALIPQLGFGTYKVTEDLIPQVIPAAISLGYRHFDTAQMYQNEAALGHALTQTQEQGVAREDLFITTKLNNQNHAPADVHRSFKQSLADLQLDYVDLFLVHWPLPKLYDGKYDETWKAMIEIYQSGQAKAIGVSNFERNHLDKIIDATGFVPHANQIQIHPYLASNELREYCKSLGIVVEAWSPISRGKVLSDPAVTAAANRLGRTAAQIVLRWAIERGDVIFPKSVNPERMKENMGLFDFTLDSETRKALDSLDQGEAGRHGPHPDEADFLR